MGKGKPKVDSWDRLPKETSPAWEAFRLYRDMGPERSLAKVAKECNKDSTLMARWSGRHKWVNRCADWDSHLDMIAQREREKQYKEMIERHIRLALAMQGKATARLQKMKPEEMNTQDVLRYINDSIKLERVSRKDAADRQAEDCSQIDVLLRCLDSQAEDVWDDEPAD